MPSSSASARLRRLLSSSVSTACPRSLAMPGAFNGLVARAVAQAGFEATYVSGAGVAAGMGLPDVGLAGLEDFTRIIRDVSACSGLPLIADADTGGGGGREGVRRLVLEYRRAGAAGLHIEDQVFPKRCGHLDGKQLVPAADFALKVQATAEARDDEEAGEEGQGGRKREGGVVICARTDARSVEGVEEVIERAKRYVDAGADMIFPEGLCSAEEFLKVSKALRGYNGVNKGEGPFLLANMTEFGKTPLLSTTRMGELGYHCTIFPMTLFRRAMRGVMEGLEELRKGGRVEGETLREGRLMTREETYELLGYTPGKEWVYPSANARGEGRGGGEKRTEFVQTHGPVGTEKEEEKRGRRRRGEHGKVRWK